MAVHGFTLQINTQRSLDAGCLEVQTSQQVALCSCPLPRAVLKEGEVLLLQPC